MDLARWQRLMNSLGMAEEIEAFHALIAAYSQEHRHYHTCKHIEHCLREFDSAPHVAHEPSEVEFALWFHDAIYDPYSSGNEEKSADWACLLLRKHGASSARVDRVRAHIMATCHDAQPAALDSQLVVDIDLSILGSDEITYADFERTVREEYRWIPSLVFRRRRAQILESFISRARIYSTEPFHTRYESQARRNLEATISALRFG